MLKYFFPVLLLGAIACNDSNTEKPTGQDSINNDKTDTLVNVLTDQQKTDGWQLLFDGKSTAGWHKYGNLPIGPAWKVANGNLYLDTTDKKDWQVNNGGDIVSADTFSNFHLKLDWKIAPNGNSGVMFYVQEDTVKYKYPWNTGPEMQVLDNDGHPDAKISKHRAGDLYDLITSSSEPVNKVGEWNTAEIESVNGKLELSLNGKNVVTTQMWDDNWKKLVAGSKFKAYPDFGTYKSGHIALQDHGNTVWFRNVMIKRL